MSPCRYCRQLPCACVRDEDGRQIAPPACEPDPVYLAHQSSGRNKYANVKPRPARLLFHGIFEQGVRRTP